MTTSTTLLNNLSHKFVETANTISEYANRPVLEMTTIMSMVNRLDHELREFENCASSRRDDVSSEMAYQYCLAQHILQIVTTRLHKLAAPSAEPAMAN